jgi:hypothetical protein
LGYGSGASGYVFLFSSLFRGHPSVAPVVMLHIFTIRAMTFALDKAKVTIIKRTKRLETMDKLEARLAKLEKEILTRPTHHCV